MKTDKFKIVAIVLILVGVAMLVGGFILPPIGEIDQSVIEAFGEIIGVVCFLGAWSCIEKAIDNNVNASVTHNGTTITVKQNEEEK